MKKKLLLTLPMLLMLHIGTAQCADDQNVFAFTYDGKTYEIIKENKSWVNAAACAVSRGGYLAEINSLEENDAIFNQLAIAGVDPDDTPASDGFSSYVWLGGNDIANEGSWVWNGNNDAVTTSFWQGTANGTAVDDNFTNWGNEPDNFGTGTGQDGLGMAVIDWPRGPAGKWNDIKHNNTLFFVVEYSTILGVDTVNKNEVALYPNPAKDIFKISTVLPVKVVTLHTMNGQAIKSTYNATSNGEISITNLPTGLYIVSIQMADGTTASRKLIKE